MIQDVPSVVFYILHTTIFNLMKMAGSSMGTVEMGLDQISISHSVFKYL